MLEELKLGATGKEITGITQTQCPSHCWPRGSNLNAEFMRSLLGWVLGHSLFPLGKSKQLWQPPPLRHELQHRMGSDGLQQLCPHGSALLGVPPNIRHGDKVSAPGGQSWQCPSCALPGPQIPQGNGSSTPLC